jgi:hypothetical protein
VLECISQRLYPLGMHTIVVGHQDPRHVDLILAIAKSKV